ncbi:MAG: GNAT family N-acetyltransferase [Candidatus Parabeggiatoa sp.]|nr:GNAT family N-acetyltransferase [Candidatus Parabeggiatoa sp.]
MKISRYDPKFKIALEGPICPQLLRDDAIVTNENGWYRTVTPSSPWAADDNEILFSNLNERDADGEIETVIAEYQKLGRPMRWCVYPWTQPAYLGERLLKRGATRSDVRAFLCDTSLPLELVEGTEIEQVDPNSTEAYEAYIEVMSSGVMSSGRTLPADEVAFRRCRYRELITGPDAVMQLFIARYEGVVAGCGAMYIKEDSGWLTGDYVVPAYQARGLFQSLIAARLKVLRDMGIQIASGHGREETSVPWLKRFGFKSIYPYRIYQIDPPSTVG